ncbi:uncharacterized protein NDAI_0B01810 [Naumovozyma dairenensis CBS 421]|uniref:Formate/nitrite transporter n=1 Tax=Naumovozyma dairenensis (strain ATCC 10597 / BCRC 20456 / CBS 421 / NBRC 0211 / NRRL Y-12639) TaxID=1071378 RepID=G0W604_NAUDC|nr:hypothetical protein NDAI_0B01810 [Naumovozyma dairenensis CBS 421]CCD23215.1 hypothetical protein NDAI_0B01810 [Naumovozyma dairenensis CBS 421]
MVDDSYYITPHEAALATVATSMKKARLHIETLILNSILGGFLFSIGGLLYTAIHADNPDLLEKNPGILNLLGGCCFGIGLFYVVIMGVDLFNSNILFFSVGLLRGAVTIYDVLLSWSISLIGNLAGSLFVCYLFVHVSKVGQNPHWIAGSRKIAEDRASFSFMETFLKGIAGNFMVCLAIYLQLLAKPTHVKALLLNLPIMSFVTIGWTHVVADMTLLFTGMLNGANVSVGKYIWKLLIPSSIGNIIGGTVFGLLIPFYLHLLVVERDRKNLSLPEYDARDEQPELNVDSRVVRITKRDDEDIAPNDIVTVSDSDSDSGSDSYTDYNEKSRTSVDNTNEGHLETNKSVNGNNNIDPNLYHSITEQGSLNSTGSTISAAASLSPVSTYTDQTTGNLSQQYTNRNGSASLEPLPFRPERTHINMSKIPSIGDISSYQVSRNQTYSVGKAQRVKSRNNVTNNILRVKSSNPRRHSFSILRSPPGVFPVRGMGVPLDRERTIEDSTYQGNNELQHKTSKLSTKKSPKHLNDELLRMKSNTSPKKASIHSDIGAQNGGNFQRVYSVLDEKPGAKLEKAITRLLERTPSNNVIGSSKDLEMGELDPPESVPTTATTTTTTQDMFPHNEPNACENYGKVSKSSIFKTATDGGSSNNIFRKFTRQFEPTSSSPDVNKLEEDMHRVGINKSAAIAANNVAGAENFSNINTFNTAHVKSKRRSSLVSNRSAAN